MGKLVKSELNTHNAKQFVESINETANSLYYVYIGKHTAFPNDLSPPTANNSNESSFYQQYRDMIYGKQITTSDVKHMVDKNAWSNGTVYAQYSHKDGGLKDKKFFVSVEEANGNYSVFKCLFNNKGAPSTDEPTKTETQANDTLYITTADKYQWKYMFDITGDEYAKFNTADKIPFKEDTAVTGNAVSGAVDVVDVISGGTRYKSVANGVVTDATVGGNNLMIEIASLVSANLALTNTTSNGSNSAIGVEKIDLLGKFANGDLYDGNTDPNTANNIANGVVVVANSTVLKVVDIAGDMLNANSTNVVVKGQITGVLSQVSSVTSDTGSLSSNTDFYKGSTFYITSGTGKGQAKNISEYIVTGSSRRVLIPSSFETSIDTTSRFEISPRVVISGDGTGAEARAIVNTSTFAVDTIEVTSRGSGYTFATATVLGNTGISGNLSANNANVDVIIGPKGGHGSDVINELYADTVGVSVDFKDDEGGLTPAQNDFRTVGIIRDPLFNNVQISVANVTLSSGASGDENSFTANEFVTQGNTTPRSNAHFYTANVTLSNTTAAGSNTTFLTTGEGYQALGKFGAGHPANNALYDGNTNPNSSNVISNGFITFANSTVITIHEEEGSFFTTATADSDSVGNVVILGVTSNVMAQQSSVSKNIIFNGARGRITARPTGELNITNVYGQFVTSGSEPTMRITGESSNSSANVTAVQTSDKDGSNFTTFDQRLRLTGFVNTSAFAFDTDEEILQDSTDANGTIHFINTSSNVDVMAITNKKGNFLASDTTSGNFYYVRGQNSGAVAYFTDTAGPDIVPNSGDILYVENVSPITRDDSQTERIKVMIKF